MQPGDNVKLSKLQRYILTEAMARELHYPIVLHHYFGLPLREGVPRKIDDPCGWHFSAKAIGYRSAKASLSRAVRRLEGRGLITRGWGVTLTPEGIAVAKRLTVRQNCQKVNPCQKSDKS